MKKGLFADSEYEEVDSNNEDDEYDEKTTDADSLGDNYEAFNDEAAKTETEDKVSENTVDEPQIPADESEHIADEQTENECTARTHNEYRSVTDENQHIKQQTKPTHTKNV